MRTLKPGDTVVRVFGNGEMKTQMRISRIDSKFIYCDAQRTNDNEGWFELPPAATHWKFDRIFGVETDETQGWGMEPYGRNLVLTRIEIWSKE